jgi:hypothetical protein
MSLVVDGTKGLGFSSALNGAGGRLTLQSGVPVMTTTQAAKTTVYYCPYIGQFLPLFDGSMYTMRDFGGELSQALTDATKSPAAALPEACYDYFGWDDNGVVRVTRGPPWLNTATITMTIASPCIVTWNGHGLHEGSPVIFTGGNYPTGIVAGTTYYVCGGSTLTANSFALSTTPALASIGTNIATTGTQSGTHTGTNRDTKRGTGAGTSELVRIGGIQLNASTIVNGALMQRATYLGTIRTNISSQADWILGGSGAGGVAAFLNVFNAYNHVDAAAVVKDTNSWSYGTAAGRALDNSITNRISFVAGLTEDAFTLGLMCYAASNGSSEPVVGIGYDSSFVPMTWVSNAGGDGTSVTAFETKLPDIGSHYFQAVEWANGGACNLGNPTAQRSQNFSASWRC